MCLAHHVNLALALTHLDDEEYEEALSACTAALNELGDGQDSLKTRAKILEKRLGRLALEQWDETPVRP